MKSHTVKALITLSCYVIRKFDFPGDENNQAEYKKTKDFTKAVQEFTVGIHDPSVPADLRGGGIKVKTGYETTIMVTPKVLHTTQSGMKMSFKERQCRTFEETEITGLKIFRQYSREVETRGTQFTHLVFLYPITLGM